METKPVVLFADSPSDLGDELIAKYHVHIIPLHVLFEGKDYLDSVDLKPNDVYKNYYEKKILPKTAAINTTEYLKAFSPWIEQGYEVLYIAIGGALSCSYQNSCMTASELTGVYPVDSCNLSTGIGLLVIKAAELIAEGKSAADIQLQLRSMTSQSHASFILDTLTFMSAGGRCSAVTAFAANLLGLKPCIVVNNHSGAMSVGRKYRGKLDRVLIKYVEDELASYDHATIDTSRIFITHAGIDASYVELVRNKINEILAFDEVIETRASCTISSHCGPNTLGILFMTK